MTIQVAKTNITKLESGYEKVNPGDYVMVRVSDTGCGIAKEDLAKIFEPYYSRKKMGRSGTGLGLSVVHGVIQDHAGYYDVLSEVGRGTDFVLYFPVTEKGFSKAASQVVKPGCESLLMVDDNAEQRELAGEILSNIGYQCQFRCQRTRGGKISPGKFR